MLEKLRGWALNRKKGEAYLLVLYFEDGGIKYCTCKTLIGAIICIITKRRFRGNDI